MQRSAAVPNHLISSCSADELFIETRALAVIVICGLCMSDGRVTCDSVTTAFWSRQSRHRPSFQLRRSRSPDRWSSTEALSSRHRLPCHPTLHDNEQNFSPRVFYAHFTAASRQVILASVLQLSMADTSTVVGGRSTRFGAITEAWTVLGDLMNAAVPCVSIDSQQYKHRIPVDLPQLSALAVTCPTALRGIPVIESRES